MLRYEIIPHKFYLRERDGLKVSIYGACPWGSDAEKKEWQTVTDGFSIRDRKQGITLNGGKTMQEAEERKNRLETLAGRKDF